jgi:MFS family permease
VNRVASTSSRTSGKGQQIRRNLRLSTQDGAAYSAMVGLGESYLAAFVLALGFSQLSSALISTLPLLAGAIIQLVSPWGVRSLRSHKRWVVYSARLQASAYFLFIAAAITQKFPEWAIYLSASIYWGASLATGPAWNTWINALVPKRLRVEFFSYRSRFTHAATLIGLISSGLALNWGRRHSLELQVFTAIFLLSAVLRFISAESLARHSEPASLLRQAKPLALSETLEKILTSPYGKVLVYLFFLQIAVHMAAGFFNPFMLRELRLPYSSYMILMGSVVLAKVLSMPIIYRLIKRWGLSKVLIFASIGIAPLPILWLFHGAMPYLILLQISSGFLWATHEISVFLILFGEIPAEDRTSVLTEFNFFQTFGMVMGALIGGSIFYYFGQNGTAYAAIFALSTAARFTCLMAIPAIRDPFRNASLRIYQRAIRPGGFQRPVVTDVEEK